MRFSLQRIACGALLSSLSACAGPPAADDVGIVVPDANVRPDAHHADAGQVLGVVTVFVRDEAGPIVGADVVVDDANGQREVGVTAAGGRVTIPGVAWGAGQITITASATNHPLQSLGGFRRSELGSHIDGTGTITFDLVSYYRAYAVHGNVVGSADSSRAVHLYLDVPGQLTVTGATFSGDVQRNQPFHLWALDYVFTSINTYHYTQTPVALVRVDHAPLTAAGTFDVDMSVGLPLTTVSGSFPLPADGNPVQMGYPGVVVTTDESTARARVGLTTEMAPAATGTRFDFTVAQLATIDTGSPVTVYYIETVDRLYAEIDVDGAATSDAIHASTDWPAPPSLVAPAADTAPLHDPIELGGVDPALPVRLTLLGQYGALWYLDLPPGGTTAAFPAPPAGTDTSGWTSTTIRVDACEPWPGHTIRCRREAGGRTFNATP